MEQLDPTELTTVIKAEMGCLDRMAEKMKTISEEICTLDTAYGDIADKGNTLCWTGTTVGRYVFAIHDQIRAVHYNPVAYTLQESNAHGSFSKIKS